MRDESPSSLEQHPPLRWLGLLPLAVGLLAALPALLNGALFDDELLIFSNPYAQSWSYLRENLTRDFFYGPGGYAIGYYRPASKLLFMLEYQWFGARTLGYHALSIVAFLLVLGLGQRLARELGLPPRAATLGVCLFASHPAVARSVATIASQSDLLVVGSMLGSLCAYLQFRRGGQRRALARALLWECVALGFKETAVVLPALMLACELDRTQLSLRRALRSAWLFGLLPVLAYGALRVQLQVLPIPLAGVSEPWALRMAASAKLLVATALRSITPLAFNPPLYTDRPSGELASMARWLSPALVLLIATLYAFVRVPSLRVVLSLLWLPAALIVAGGTAIHISEDPGALVLSDRWLLLPALGASLLLGSLLDAALARIPRPALRLAVTLSMAGVVVTQMLVTAEENASFASENARVLHLAALYRQAEARPRDADEVLLAADAISAERRGDVRAAVEAHAKLLALKPEDSVRRYNLASALLRAGQLQAALEQAHTAFHGSTLAGVELYPPNDSSGRRRAEKALLLGLIHERLGHADLARDYFALCLTLNPAEPLARSKLAAPKRAP
jgi:tetratricopeptide (TPR) repeat protein